MGKVEANPAAAVEGPDLPEGGGGIPVSGAAGGAKGISSPVLGRTADLFAEKGGTVLGKRGTAKEGAAMVTDGGPPGGAVEKKVGGATGGPAD